MKLIQFKKLNEFNFKVKGRAFGTLIHLNRVLLQKELQAKQLVTVTIFIEKMSTPSRV